MVRPGARPVRELLALPFMWGILIGCAFGTWDVVTKRQVIHKPALERYYEHNMPVVARRQESKASRQKEKEKAEEEKLSTTSDRRIKQ